MQHQICDYQYMSKGKHGQQARRKQETNQLH